MIKQVTFLILIISWLVLQGCTSGSGSSPNDAPPNVGVFLWNGEYTQIDQGVGEPSETTMPETSDNRPVFAMSGVNVRMIVLQGYSGNRLGSAIPVVVTQEEGYSTVTPQEDMRPGNYCFVEGDPQRSFYAHPWWCFKIAGQVVQLDNRDSEVIPPGTGTYLVIDGSAEELLPLEIIPTFTDQGYLKTEYRFLEDLDASNRLDISRLPSTSNPVPIVVTNLNISVNSLSLYSGRIGIGVNWENVGGYLTITGVSPNYPAEEAGIFAGDIVLAIDGQQVNGSTDLGRSLISIHRVNDPVQVTILRGTQSFDVLAETTVLGISGRESFNVNPMSGYVQLIPQYQLIGGTYCYLLDARAWDGDPMYTDEQLGPYSEQAWCFQVE